MLAPALCTGGFLTGLSCSRSSPPLQPTRRSCFAFKPSRPPLRRHSRSRATQPASGRNLQKAWRICATASAEETVDIEEDAMDRMERSFEATQRSFATVRTGRANPGMLDRIQVDYYGAATPIKSIAGISAPDAAQLVIQPYDLSAMPAIERAIMQSDLGITPSNDGRVIRINIPALTADRRKEMIKTVSKLGEDGKVAIRNVRRDAIKAIGKLEKDGDLSEDAAKNMESAVQDLTDDYVKQIDKLIKAKESELTEL